MLIVLILSALTKARASGRISERGKQGRSMLRPCKYFLGA
jgi:hypothetical protein